MMNLAIFVNLDPETGRTAPQTDVGLLGDAAIASLSSTHHRRKPVLGPDSSTAPTRAMHRSGHDRADRAEHVGRRTLGRGRDSGVVRLDIRTVVCHDEVTNLALGTVLRTERRSPPEDLLQLVTQHHESGDLALDTGAVTLKQRRNMPTRYVTVVTNSQNFTDLSERQAERLRCAHELDTTDRAIIVRAIARRISWRFGQDADGLPESQCLWRHAGSHRKLADPHGHTLDASRITTFQPAGRSTARIDVGGALLTLGAIARGAHRCCPAALGHVQ